MVNRRKAMGIIIILSSMLLLASYTYLVFLANPEIQYHVIRLTVYGIVLFLVMALMVIGVGLLKSPIVPSIGQNNNDTIPCLHEKDEKEEYTG